MVDGVAVRPTGVQSRALILNGILIVYPLLASVAVMMTLTVPVCVRSDPNKAIFVPSI